MKKIFFTLFSIIGLMSFSFSQAIYSSADTVWIQGPNMAHDDDYSDLEAGFLFKNNSAISDSFRWVRTVNVLPSDEWQSAVCDINLCYPTDVDSADFLMSAGDSGIFYPHFYPGKGIGIGEMVIEIFNINDRSQKVTIVAYADVWDAYNSVQQLSNKIDADIYPNPTNDNSTIIVKGKAELNISIRNIQGELLIERYINSQDREINVQTFPKGVYFIELNDGHNTKVQKLILN